MQERRPVTLEASILLAVLWEACCGDVWPITGGVDRWSCWGSVDQSSPNFFLGSGKFHWLLPFLQPCGPSQLARLFLPGCSQNFSWALSARFLWGMLNGNLGVAKTFISEVRNSTHHVVRVLFLSGAKAVMITWLVVAGVRQFQSCKGICCSWGIRWHWKTDSWSWLHVIGLCVHRDNDWLDCRGPPLVGS